MRYELILVCAVWLASPVVSAGQTTYKCRSTEGRITYQDVPCAAQTDGAVDLQVDKPDPAEAARIRQQTLSDQKELIRSEKARQHDQSRRITGRQEPSRDEKCAELQRQAREANERLNMRKYAGSRAMEERKKKEAADRFFSECPHKVLTYK